MKQHFSFFLGTALFAFFNQAHAELVINGATMSTPTTTALSNSTYSPNSNFQACIANLRSQAISSGVSGATYDRYTQNLTPDYSVIDKLNYQPEFSTAIWDYLSGLVDNERVQAGQQKLAQHRDAMSCLFAFDSNPSQGAYNRTHTTSRLLRQTGPARPCTI